MNVTGAWRAVRVAAGERPPFDWAGGSRVALPGAALPGDAGAELNPQTAPPVGPADVAAIRLARAWLARPPASGRLPFRYHVIPAPVRTLLGRWFARFGRAKLTRDDFFPLWPLDLSADFLADLLAPEDNPFRRGPTPVLISHDIDSPAGLQNLVRHFLPLEERYCGRSANYVVPCKWPLDHGLLAEVARRGHELGIHGYDHSNRTPFAAPDERRIRLDAARPLIQRYGMKGYRAPSLVRTAALLADLAQHYAYDSSIPTSGGLFPVAGNGCASARPFPIGRLLEIPLSLPRDGSLLFLGHSPGEILDLWKQCTEQIARSRGVVVLLTHCEAHFTGNPPMLEAYERFLAWVAGRPDLRFASTQDVCHKAIPAG